MSSTRRASEQAPMSQECYASSAVHESGLLGNLVARRCKTIRKPEDRSLVYYLQALSHRDGGLQRVADEVIAMFPARLRTRGMVSLDIQAAQTLTDSQREVLRKDFPERYTHGEIINRDTYECEDVFPFESDALLSFCRENADEWLTHCLTVLCLDPTSDLEVVPFAIDRRSRLSDHGLRVVTWWIDDLLSVLHEYRRRSITAAERSIAQTTISRQIFEDLDYCLHSRGLVIIEGDQRTGKSTAAKTWCDMHPGQAVYVRLESGIDEATFFRAFSRAVGTASSLQRKSHEMRMRVQDMVQEGHLILVIDEAQFIWGQTIRPRSAPARVDWIRTALLDYGVGVAWICTPQFDRQTALYEKHLNWNAKQIRGRVKLHRHLPIELPVEDLAAVARKMAPQADEVSIERLVCYAEGTDDYLAGIERLTCRASFFADRAVPSRAVNAADISRALDEAMPTMQPVPPPAQKPRRVRSTRALPLQTGCKELSDSVPPALARRAGMGPAASTEAPGSRIQFAETAPTE